MHRFVRSSLRYLCILMFLLSLSVTFSRCNEGFTSTDQSGDIGPVVDSEQDSETTPAQPADTASTNSRGTPEQEEEEGLETEEEEEGLKTEGEEEGLKTEEEEEVLKAEGEEEGLKTEGEEEGLKTEEEEEGLKTEGEEEVLKTEGVEEGLKAAEGGEQGGLEEPGGGDAGRTESGSPRVVLLDQVFVEQDAGGYVEEFEDDPATSHLNRQVDSQDDEEGEEEEAPLEELVQEDDSVKDVDFDSIDVEEFIQFADVDHNGVVSSGEVLRWLRRSKEGSLEEVVHSQWTHYDSNQDGTVSWVEYKRAVFLGVQGPNGGPMSSAEKDKYLAQEWRKFETADVDHNETLSLEELRTALFPTLYDHMIEYMVEEMLKDFDNDSDGLISLEEYRVIFSQYLGDNDPYTMEQISSDLAEYFNEYDNNRDGVLDVAELMVFATGSEEFQPAKDTERLLNLSDEDENGELSRDELMKHFGQFKGTLEKLLTEVHAATDEGAGFGQGLEDDFQMDDYSNFYSSMSDGSDDDDVLMDSGPNVLGGGDEGNFASEPFSRTSETASKDQETEQKKDRLDSIPSQQEDEGDIRDEL